MLEYLRSFYIDMNRGPGYGITNVILFSGAVLMLSRHRDVHSVRGGGVHQFAAD